MQSQNDAHTSFSNKNKYTITFPSTDVNNNSFIIFENSTTSTWYGTALKYKPTGKIGIFTYSFNLKNDYANHTHFITFVVHCGDKDAVSWEMKNDKLVVEKPHCTGQVYNTETKTCMCYDSCATCSTIGTASTSANFGQGNNHCLNCQTGFKKVSSSPTSTEFDCVDDCTKTENYKITSGDCCWNHCLRFG